MSDIPLMAGLYDGRRGVYYEVRVNSIDSIVAINMLYSYESSVQREYLTVQYTPKSRLHFFHHDHHQLNVNHRYGIQSIPVLVSTWVEPPQRPLTLVRSTVAWYCSCHRGEGGRDCRIERDGDDIPLAGVQ